MKCHCCNSEYRKIFNNTFRCDSCGHTHRDYKGDEVEYHKSQYRNIERRDRSEISDDGQIRQLFHEKRKDICEKRLEFVSKYVKKDDNCLDIGAGAGTYANLLSSHVSTIQCTELDPSLISECTRLGFEVFTESFLDLEFDGRYDVVSAWHVLEHVHNIDLFLRKCRKITKKYCIIEVPMLSSISGQGRTRKLTDPSVGSYDGHAHYFTKESFTTIASQYFEIVEIKEGVQSPALFVVMKPKAFRVAHFGSYNVNIGDNIALLNIRKGLEDVFGQEFEWTDICISEFHSYKPQMNNVEFSKQKFITISEQNDLLIIGGGGLIESTVRESNGTKWKLPFTSEILSQIDIPIVCFSLGINYFRNYPKLNKKAIENLFELKEYSSLFSLRNDGSLDIYQSIYNEKCSELPDPGLVFLQNTVEKKNNLKKGFFQPAWNNNAKQLIGRKLHPKTNNLKKISEFCKQFSLDIMPHTVKDFSFPHNKDNFIYSKDKFKELVKFKNFEKIIEKYLEYDFSIAMRGHGQLISIGLGLPSIYFSTQDKVKNFSIKNGFEDYNVDIEEKDWEDKLIDKTNRLMQDNEYLAKWYEIRNENMLQYNQNFKDFCLDIVKVI